MQVVITIVNKPFITEMDLLRLQKALLMARMAADGTFLVDKEWPGYSSKLEELERVLSRLVAEEGRKIVVFSEWSTMLDSVEEVVGDLGTGFVRLDGSVPQGKRRSLVRAFQEDPECRLFLATNAAATGLNLQAADVVVNVDLPWNPAVLEQRIGRAHRMGQKRPVHVLLLVTEATIEERMLGTLSAKHVLAQAVLDADSELDAVDMSSGVEELKQRLEVLIGRKPEAPVDESQRAQVEAAAEQRKERVALAGGRLLDAAFSFLAEALPGAAHASEADPDIAGGLAGCVAHDGQGRPQLTLTLPDEAALERIAACLTGLARAAEASNRAELPELRPQQARRTAERSTARDPGARSAPRRRRTART